MDIVIKSVSKEIIDDYLYFFDNIKFTKHPNWSICYCYSFHFVGTAKEWNDKAKNRSSVIKLISEGKMKGYLAYYNNKPIGWCNANNKLNYERLKLNKNIWNNINGNICSIVCFLIDKDYRNKKVGTRLLLRVYDDYKKYNYDYIEAYPKKGNLSEEDQCTGPLSMYKKLDFKIINEYEDYYMSVGNS